MKTAERERTDQNEKPLLRIENLAVGLNTRDGTVFPVEGVDIAVPEGKVVGIVGESGCGKSMTAMSVMGLLPKKAHIARGEILFRGESLTEKSAEQRRRIYGNEISMIFQEPMTSLNPIVPVGRQILESICVHQAIPRAQAKEKVLEMLRQVGISEAERRFHEYPFQLSGGLRQRIMIAMAMVGAPGLLIADEPTTALDVTIEAQILRLIRQLQRTFGTAVLLITHNFGVVAEICDTVYVMYAGKIIESADVYELFRNPLHPYTQGLMRAQPNLSGKERLYNIAGTVPRLSDMPQGCRFHPRCRYACDRCRAAQEPPLAEVSQGHRVRCILREGDISDERP